MGETTGMLQLKNVLVTGGTGLVGSNLRELVHGDDILYRKYNFTFLSRADCDLRNQYEVSKLYKKYYPDIIINLAARVGGLYANLKDNDGFYSDNYSMNKYLIDSAQAYGIEKCISCLSTCIFPDKVERYPLTEKHIHLGPPSSSNSGYSLAKRQVDIMNREYSAKIKDGKFTLFTALIPTNIYGKYDNFNLSEAHVVPALIHKAYKVIKTYTLNLRTERKRPPYLKVCGSGKPLRQFIYAPDLARIFIWMLENYNEVEPMIVANDIDEEISIKQVAETIVEAFDKKMGVRLELKFDHTHFDGQFKKTASNAKLRRYLPGFEFTPFDQGIQETVDWFCDNYQTVRTRETYASRGFEASPCQ